MDYNDDDTTKETNYNKYDLTYIHATQNCMLCELMDRGKSKYLDCRGAVACVARVPDMIWRTLSEPSHAKLV